MGLGMMLLLTAASCQRLAVGYRFNPVAGSVAAAPRDSIRLPASAPAAFVPLNKATRAAPLPAPPRVFSPRKTLPTKLVAVAPRLVKRVARRPEATQTQRRLARPQQPAEVGLGTTVLGVLGLVVAPLSLIGLLIWGGPVWAVLLGLSALAVLVAWIDPFQ